MENGSRCAAPDFRLLYEKQLLPNSLYFVSTADYCQFHIAGRAERNFFARTQTGFPPVFLTWAILRVRRSNVLGRCTAGLPAPVRYGARAGYNLAIFLLYCILFRPPWASQCLFFVLPG